MKPFYTVIPDIQPLRLALSQQELIGAYGSALEIEYHIRPISIPSLSRHRTAEQNLSLPAIGQWFVEIIHRPGDHASFAGPTDGRTAAEGRGDPNLLSQLEQSATGS
jgi:hypothetical protein